MISRKRSKFSYQFSKGTCRAPEPQKTEMQLRRQLGNSQICQVYEVLEATGAGAKGAVFCVLFFLTV